MTLVADEANAAAQRDQLESRGLLVVKIEPPFAKVASMAAIQPKQRRH
jgi:hypothetical protein